MRILVFSDSHKNISDCEKIVNNTLGVDMIIHAGDHSSDAAWLKKIFPEIPIKYVNGNCDYISAPYELIIEAENFKIFLTHGHSYHAKSEERYQTLIDKAVSSGCDCVVFGHTHIPYNDASGKITVLNPGSVKYTKTYGVIEIENGKLRTAVCDATSILFNISE